MNPTSCFALTSPRVFLKIFDVSKHPLSGIFPAKIDEIKTFSSNKNNSESSVLIKKIYIFSQKCFSSINEDKNICILPKISTENFFNKNIATFYEDEYVFFKEGYSQLFSSEINVLFTKNDFVSTLEVLQIAKDNLDDNEYITFSSYFAFKFANLMKEKKCFFDISIAILSLEEKRTSFLFAPEAFLPFIMELIYEKFQNYFESKSALSFISKLVDHFIAKCNKNAKSYGSFISFIKSIFSLEAILKKDSDPKFMYRISFEKHVNSTGFYLGCMFVPDMLTESIDKYGNISFQDISEWKYVVFNRIKSLYKSLNPEKAYSIFLKILISSAEENYICKFMPLKNEFYLYSKTELIDSPCIVLKDCFVPLLYASEIPLLKLMDICIDLISKNDKDQIDVQTTCLYFYSYKILKFKMLNLSSRYNLASFIEKMNAEKIAFANNFSEWLSLNKNKFSPSLSLIDLCRYGFCILGAVLDVDKIKEMLKILLSMISTVDKMDKDAIFGDDREKIKECYFLAQSFSVIIYESIEDIPLECVENLIFSIFASIFPECFESKYDDFRNCIGMSGREMFHIDHEFSSKFIV